MANLSDVVINTASEQKSQQNQRKHTVVRTCGEEHTGHSDAGTATVYLPTDPEMEYIAQLRFKLILGEPLGENKPVVTPGGTGYPVDRTHSPFNTWQEFYNYFVHDDFNGAVDMDGQWGYQCLTAGAMVLMDNGTYKDVAELVPGDKLDGNKYVLTNEPQLADVIKIKTNIGTFTSTLNHRIPLEFGGLTESQDLVEGDHLQFGNAIVRETYDLTDDELKFLGFYLGDGTKKYRWANSKTPEILVTVGTEMKEQFLDSIDVNLKRRSHSNGKALIYSLVNKTHPVLAALIHQIDGKKLPQWFSARQYRHIIDGYIKADGWTHHRQLCAISTCKELLVSLQYGCLINGWTARISDPVLREKTNLCDHPKPLWKLVINKNQTFEHVVVEQIVHLEEQETVYVLNISGDHLYCADNIVHHNCWDLADFFWVSNCGRRLETGNNFAYGCWTLMRDYNAGTEFSLVTNWNDVKAGDWVIWAPNTSQTRGAGHVNMALEDAAGKTSIKMLGQNQENPSDTYGHFATVDNWNSDGFLGAFRYRYWRNYQNIA